MTSDFSCVPGAPVSADTAALARLHAALTELNYTYDGVEKLLGSRAFEAMTRDQVVPGLYRVNQILGQEPTSETFTAAQRNLAQLVRFFLFGAALAGEELEDALGPGSLELLLSLGLAEPAENGLVQAAVDLRPHAADDGTELFVASDMGAHQRPGVLRRDHVLGIGHASLTLAQLTERTAVDRALDLGTGCGIQVFHLLAHTRHVTATDISERALAFTRFNLLLNASALGLDVAHLEERVSLRLGSLLEPVAGETFDLVVSNPPFVITPRSEQETPEDQFTYRDGGMAGDGIVSTLVQQLPSVLAPGGRAQMLGNWEIPVDGQDGPADWAARPRAWVGEQTEAWFIQREVLEPEQYAETWLRDASENRDPAHFEAAYTAYLRDFASRGVGSIGFGMIWLRQPDPASAGERLHRFEEITYPIQQPIAPFITEAVQHYDQVTALSDAQLLEQHLVVAGDVTEERHFTPGSEHPSVILLRAGAGLRRTILETTETSGFVSACDGELSAGQIVGALTALLGWEGEEPQRVLLSNMRELLEKSFLRFDQKD
ncbi:MAG: methyltransferase [Rothia sp. (in: high G+C Gram-positive bacteria)]|nr:methyltransferase [Rothia sp. (in: high G+C Gram-positive bacteria)]